MGEVEPPRLRDELGQVDAPAEPWAQRGRSALLAHRLSVLVAGHAPGY
eukprot:COSAG01_NODE_30441_length_616_cov_0.597679_1_plen_47_part_10